MRRIFSITALLVVSAILLGCESSGNPFAGSQWDVGIHHLSFSQVVAEWDTANNRMILKFGLLSGSSYPNAEVVVDGVTTLTVNQPRDCDVTVAVSQGEEYECIAGDADINATITFTRFDLGPLGAVSGQLTGIAQRIGVPSDPLVDLEGSFNDVIVTN